jgi:hypothetical protein
VRREQSQTTSKDLNNKPNDLMVLFGLLFFTIMFGMVGTVVIALRPKWRLTLSNVLLFIIGAMAPVLIHAVIVEAMIEFGIATVNMSRPLRLIWSSIMLVIPFISGYSIVLLREKKRGKPHIGNED